MKAQGMAQESVGVAALRGKLSPSKEKLARRWCGGGAVVARRMRRLNVSDAARAQSDAARHLEDAAPVVVDAAMSGGLVESVASTSVLSGYHDTDHVQRYDGTATAVELNPDPWKICVMIHLMLPFFPFLLAIHYAVRVITKPRNFSFLGPDYPLHHPGCHGTPGYLDYDVRVIVEPRQTDLRRHTGGQELLSNSPDRPGDPQLLSKLYTHNSPYL
ncbi:hypothetical protein C8R47DRAFT_1077381 [Mycena vitilis]|nr:hypothetical protein C8R47DRAFT_1077381 [Mycena vitilis]